MEDLGEEIVLDWLSSRLYPLELVTQSLDSSDPMTRAAVASSFLSSVLVATAWNGFNIALPV